MPAPQEFDPEDQVQVPDPDEMDDETFLKHIDKRHSHETQTEKKLHKSPHIAEAWVGAYRAFHEYKHRVSGEDAYDHVHVWDDDGNDD